MNSYSDLSSSHRRGNVLSLGPTQRSAVRIYSPNSPSDDATTSFVEQKPLLAASSSSSVRHSSGCRITQPSVNMISKQSKSSSISSTKKGNQKSKYPEVKHKGRKRKIAYLFSGKLSIFPMLLVLLVFGIGLSIFHGVRMCKYGEFMSREMYFAVFGAILVMIATMFLFLLLGLVVIRISFTVSRTMLEIRKQGIIRRTKFQFDTMNCRLHVFRTHFSPEKAWLCLCVEENGVFYRIMSWKGKGAQRKRFLNLFASLSNILERCRAEEEGRIPQEFSLSTTDPIDILTREEISFSAPFRNHLRKLQETGRRSSKRAVESAAHAGILCIDDLNVKRVDKVFESFSNDKKLRVRASSSRTK